jgi:hypothetical protein
MLKFREKISSVMIFLEENHVENYLIDVENS